MIHRIDLPDQSTFTNASDGVPPQHSKWTTPISQIRVTDTVYNFPSNGLTAYWYANTSVGRTTPVGTAYQGNMPMCKFWYGNNLPPVISPSKVSGGWSLKLKGYIQAQTKSLNFGVAGAGKVTLFKVSGSDITPTTQELSLTTVNPTVGTLVSLTEGNWYSFELHYQQPRFYRNANSGLCVLWSSANGRVPGRVLLSGGVTTITTGGVPVNGKDAIQSTAIPFYGNVNLSISEGQSSTFTFEVPIIASVGPTSSAGFFYRYQNDLYENRNNKNVILKKFRKIDYYEGYVNPSGTSEMVQKFSGQIRDFNVKMSPNQAPRLEVVCHDYSILTRETTNVDAPNPIDYVIAGYMSEVPGHVNGRTKPPCFDGWEVHKAFMTMCVNSYLDPYYAVKRERKSDRSGALIYGNYYVQPYGNSYQLYLDRDPINYGNPYTISQEGQGDSIVKPDAEYSYEVGFGEYYQDSISKIAAVYGMEWGVNRYGYPYLKCINAPRSYLNDRDTTYITYSGTWSHTGVDINALKATYSDSSVYRASAQASFTGSKCAIIVGRSPRAGSGTWGSTATPSIYTQIRKSGTAVETNVYNLWLDTARHYYQGDYLSLGNPCYISVGNNLTYDNYTVHVCVHDAGQELRLEGFLFYDDDIDGTKFKFKSSDSGGPAQISQLDVSNTGQDIRNEAYVLGKVTGYMYGVSSDQSNNDSEIKTGIINPNNPITTYVQSITRDIDSIYKSTASNYVGMPKRTIITDPSIVSQEQADYLSYNFVKEYSQKHRNLDVISLGNPLLEVNDKVSINDDLTVSVTSSMPFWVKSVGTDFKETYTSQFTINSFKPIASYFPKPQPNIDADFGGIPILNLRIENRGTVTRMPSGISSGETNYVTLSSVSGIPSRGYLYMRDLTKSYKSYEVIKYSSVDSVAKRVRYLIRGLQYGSAKAWGNNAYTIAAYDPYQQEGMGIVPTVKFDSLVNGKLYLRIMGDRNDAPIHVDTLTGLGGPDWPYKSYDTIYQGKDISYTWNARDNTGKWNQHFIDIEEQTEMKGAVGWYVTEPRDINGVPQVSRFYLDFQFIDDTGKTWFYSSKESNGRLVSTASIVTRRGVPGVVSVHIQSAGCWYPKVAQYGIYPSWATTEEIPGANGYTKRDLYNHTFVYSTAKTNNRIRNPIWNATNDTAYPYHYVGVDTTQSSPRLYGGVWPFKDASNPSYGGYKLMRFLNDQTKTFAVPMWFTATSNNNQGLIVLIRSGYTPYNQDYTSQGAQKTQEVLDPEYRRFYDVDLKWRKEVISIVGHKSGNNQGGWDFVRMGGNIVIPFYRTIRPFGGDATWGESTGQIFLESDSGIWVQDSDISHDFYNNGNGFALSFNPGSIPDYSYAPINRDAYNEYARFDTAYFGISHIINFSGTFTDNSGRHTNHDFQISSHSAPSVVGDLWSESPWDDQSLRYFSNAPNSSTKLRYDENWQNDRRVVWYYDKALPTYREAETSDYITNPVRFLHAVRGSNPQGDDVDVTGENDRINADNDIIGQLTLIAHNVFWIWKMKI